MYFYDVGLAVFLEINNESYIDSHPMKGDLFENFIVTEFLKNRFNHVMISDLYFFRDNIGNEIDIILDYSTKFVSVEIKSSSTIQPKTFKGLDYYHKLAGEKNTKRYCLWQ